MAPYFKTYRPRGAFEPAPVKCWDGVRRLVPRAPLRRSLYGFRGTRYDFISLLSLLRATTGGTPRGDGSVVSAPRLRVGSNARTSVDDECFAGYGGRHGGLV